MCVTKFFPGSAITSATQRWAMALCVLSVTIGASPAIAKEGAPASVAVYQGVLRLVPIGDQVQCDGPVLQTRLTYLAMPGVCDDLGRQPCAGRLIAEIERCTADGIALTAGSLTGGYSRSPVRFCVEPGVPVPGAAVVCSEHNHVGFGTWTGAGHADAAAPVLDATAVLKLQRVRTFVLDGRPRRLSRDRQLQQFSQERSVPGPTSCAVAQPGCGVIGVAWADTPR